MRQAAFPKSNADRSGPAAPSGGIMRKAAGRRALRAAALSLTACATAGMAGCSTIGNYLNLRNSFLDPSQVGRFDKANPYGRVEPVKWPILDSLDISDPPTGPLATSRPPTARDIIPQVKEYVLGPGDVLQVSVFDLVVPGEESVQTRRINSLGYISLDFIGQVLCSGLTASQLQEKIVQVLVNSGQMKPASPGRPGPQVSVEVRQSRTRVFSIIGAAIRPGTYNILTPDFRLLDALALAGDIQNEPGMHWLYIIRQEPYATHAKHHGKRHHGRGHTGRDHHKHNAFNTLEHLQNEDRGRRRHHAGHDRSNGGDSGHSHRHETTRPAADRGRNDSSDLPVLHTIALADALDRANRDATNRGANSTSAGRSHRDNGADATAPATGPSTNEARGHRHRRFHAPANSRKTQSLLNQAISQPSVRHPVRYVFIDGRWVPIEMQPHKTTPPVNHGHAPSPKPTRVPTTRQYSKVLTPNEMVRQRIIRINLRKLRDGVGRENIVIRPGDIINIPAIHPGYFYMMGNVQRPGTYSFSGTRITLKMAVAAAGNLGPLAIPRRCEVTRRVDGNREITVAVNLQRIFDGTEPDIYLKPNDVVNIGTDALAPFLAVTRNAYRLSYGFGFVYDRNFYVYPPGTVP